MKRILLLALACASILTAGTLQITSSTGNVGEYNALLNGTDPLVLNCIDFHRPILDDPWPVTVTTYDTPAAPLWAKQIDWLHSHAASQSQGQYAVWLYMSGGTSPNQDGAGGLLFSMLFVPWASWASYDPSFVLYDGGRCVQRFVDWEPEGRVPEPATYGLMGVGLLALAWLRARK